MNTSSRSTSAHRPPALAGRAWAASILAVGGALLLAAFSGGLLAQLMPRGPVTTSQALIALLVGAATGIGGGLLLRSRWAVPLVPLVQVAAFELARPDLVGMTVEGVHLDTAYGVLAFLLGRGVYALLVLLPMAVGAAFAVSFGRPSRAPGRRAALLLLSLGLLAGAVAWLLRPASTPPMPGPNGEPLPGSIARLEQVQLGGQDGWILLRGQDVTKPVLLYLSGGPGQSDLGLSRVLLADLTRDFVVVSWDQRGTGKAYPALDPTRTLTLDRAVADTVELTHLLRRRFSERKIYLLGESWGSTLGVLAAQRHPELYHAFIGSGQMVSQRETDRRLYRDVLALAARTGDTGLEVRMRAYGEPPYQDLFAMAVVMGQYGRLETPYTPPEAYLKRGQDAHLGFWGMGASEYTLIERVSVLRGLMDMFSVMYPQLQGLDFRRDVPALGVPVYLLDGEHELSARRDLAREWFGGLDAPIKRRYTFSDAGHAVAFEEFQAFHRLLTQTIVPETYQRP